MNRDSILTAFAAQYGFNPRGIYCSVTGKLVGMTLNEEFNALCEKLIGEADEDDAEAVADDLAIRLLASMRPSLRWNKFGDRGITDARVNHPVETLAYLCNRMFQPLGHRKIGLEALLATYENKIKAFRIIESWGITDATNTLTYMLLEIDAKWSLDTESPPFSWQAFFVEAPDMDARVSMLQHWYTDRMEAWLKRVKAEEMQVKWTRHGNVASKPAFAAAYMESRPLSLTALKKAEKQAENDMFADLLFGIMGSPNLAGEEQKPPVVSSGPTFVPIRKMPRKFGVKS